MSAQKPEPVSRPRGRPRVDEPMTSISVRVPMSVHDHICRLALKRDEKVAQTVRTLLTLKLPR